MLIREASASDVGAIARVHVDSWNTTYAGIPSLSYENRELLWNKVLSARERTSFAYVAEDEEGVIAGFASGGPEREGDTIYRGELYSIYLLEQYQRRGIGRRLTLAVARRLLEQGIDSMLLWVLTDNPARKFYEGLGAKWIREKPISLGSVEAIEVAYGWRNLKELVEAHG